jgi:hypothetical protein
VVIGHNSLYGTTKLNNYGIYKRVSYEVQSTTNQEHAKCIKEDENVKRYHDT